MPLVDIGSQLLVNFFVAIHGIQVLNTCLFGFCLKVGSVWSNSYRSLELFHYYWIHQV